MEYRYSTKCPAHHQNIETRRSQTFKYGGNSYGGPIFYCNRCKKYYLFVEGSAPFEKLKTTAPSGLTIEIRKGAVSKAPTKKSKMKQETNTTVTKKDTEVENKKKKNSGKKGKNKHKAIIEKNNQLKKQLQESLKQIRCEMNCPNHPDRVMTTKNCIDVEDQKRLPLFYCIDCGCYYVSCPEFKEMKLGRLNRKDFFNFDKEVIITNPQNGSLNSVGSFSITVDLSREDDIPEEENTVENEETKTEENVVVDDSDDIESESVVNVIKPEKPVQQVLKHKKEVQESSGITFDDWSFEDTEDELFKDFIQKD